MLQATSVGGSGGSSVVIDSANLVRYTDPTINLATWVIDEDTFITNSDVLVPTQQSVKAYVDGRTWTYLRVSDADSPILAVPYTFYLIDTSNAPVTINLPAGVNDDAYGFADAAATFHLNNVIVNPAVGETISNVSALTLDTARNCFTTVFNSGNHIITSAEDFVDETGTGTGTTGGASWTYQTVTAVDSPITAADGVFYKVDASLGPVEIQLPPASAEFRVGVGDATGSVSPTNTITLVPSGVDTVAGQSELVLDSPNQLVKLIDSGDGSNWMFEGAETFVDKQTGGGAYSFSADVIDLGTVNTVTNVSIDWSQIYTRTAIVDTGAVVDFTFDNLPTNQHTQIFFFLRYLGGAFSFPANVAWSGMGAVGTQYVFDPGYDYLIVFDAVGGAHIGAGVSIKTPGTLF